MKPQVVPVPVDPYHPTTGLLIPQITQRIIETARVTVPELSPLSTAKAYLTRLSAGDPRFTIFALVTPKGECVGHAVADVQRDGDRTWANIPQIRADGNVGDALRLTVETIEGWARTFGATHLVMATGNGEKSWEEEMGFKTLRRLKVRECPAAS